MKMISQEDLLRIIPTTSFQTSSKGYDTTLTLKSIFGFPTNAKIARLAIGRSLAEPSLPKLDVDAKGNVIKGTNLFSLEESALWVGLIITHALQYGHPEIFDLKIFQSLVKAHWHRGAQLLFTDWQQSDEDYKKLIDLLITRRAKLPLHVDPLKKKVLPFQELYFDDHPFPLFLKIGTRIDKDEDFEWCINGVGYSPHMAIMGQAGAGKTRVLLNILQQIKETTSSSILLFDLGKGDLADKPELASSLNAKVLRIPEDAIPLDIFHFNDKTEHSISDMVMGFRDSFSKVCTTTLGANQKENIREALKPLFRISDKISLSQIRDSLIEYYQENDLKTDSVISTINDLNERSLFTPDLTPYEFFNQNWIITFGTALETYKNLCMFLVLDAINYYNRSIPEAQTDTNGNRSIRTILAIDEARNILSSRHLALSECIRLHRSKGLVVMLSSQSPDDYDGTSDDYLENIGLPICLKTNAKSTQVLQNMFKSKPNFSNLKTGECYTLDDGSILKLRLF